MSGLRQATQTLNLGLFPPRVPRRQTVLSFQMPYPLGSTKSLSQNVYQGSIHIINGLPHGEQLF